MKNDKLSDEDKKFIADMDLIRSTITKQAAEIEKMRIDGLKTQKETHRYDLTIGIAVTLAIVAFTKLFL